MNKTGWLGQTVSMDDWSGWLVVLGLLTVLVLLLLWAVRRLRRTYRWYLNQGDDEEKLEEELEFRRSLSEEYFESGGGEGPGGAAKP